MILYFTGSGNSEYVGNALADKLNDEVVSINNIIKSNLSKEFTSSKPFVVIAPIYAWRLPRIIEDFIKEANFKGNKMIYIIATMASQSGNAQRYSQKIIESKGMSFMGFRAVRMPDNYVIYTKMPSNKKIAEILNKAQKSIAEIANIILNNEKLTKDEGYYPVLFNKLLNDFFYRFMITDKNYVVNESCIGCGMCKEFCPVNNIEIVNNQPKFLGNCLNCYSCIHHCPTQAINIKNHTEKHGRYLCPPYQSKKK